MFIFLDIMLAILFLVLLGLIVRFIEILRQESQAKRQGLWMDQFNTVYMYSPQEMEMMKHLPLTNIQIISGRL